MQEATTLKRVKPEPSDGTPANKRLKPDELERVVTPEGDSQQVEIDHVVDPETRAREAIRAAEAAGDIIDTVTYKGKKYTNLAQRATLSEGASGYLTHLGAP